MSDDTFWALVNIGVLAVSLVGYGVVLWCNARANRRQLEQIESRVRAGR
ncbi:hypothetical protein ABZW49_10490 [Nonomuraea wenchangensis]